VEVIGREEEARRMWLGVRSRWRRLRSTAVVVDIGGGSTEWIAGDDDEVFLPREPPRGRGAARSSSPCGGRWSEERERLKGVALRRRPGRGCRRRILPSRLSERPALTTLAALDMGLKFTTARVSGYRMSSAGSRTGRAAADGCAAQSSGLEAGRGDRSRGGCWATLSVYRESVVVSDGDS
jgi:hypothetical protein